MAASGHHASVSGGGSNKANGSQDSVSGVSANWATTGWTSVVGGRGQLVDSDYEFKPD